MSLGTAKQGNGRPLRYKEFEMEENLMKKPIIQELEDGRIIKEENGKFTELVNGK